MAVHTEVDKSRNEPHTRVFQTNIEPAVIFGLIVAMAVLIAGGYGAKWSWTGFKENNTLWDWLKLTILPIALGTLGFWLKLEGRQSTVRSRWWWFALPAAAFVVIMIGGYVWHWAWTGFPGNKLWDWLHLLILPLVLLGLPFWIRIRRRYRPGWRIGVSAVIGIFVILVIGGYVVPWSWTGFPGNVLWDWMDLLLVPFIVPVVFLYLRARMEERRAAAVAEQAQQDASRGGVGGPLSTGADTQRADGQVSASAGAPGQATPCPHCGRSD